MRGELNKAGETGLVYKRVKNPFLVFSGYQYRIHQESSKLISWVCVKDKCGKCTGKLKNNLQLSAQF
jgi:hypothetical protein